MGLIEQAEALTEKVQIELKGAGLILPGGVRALIRDMCGMLEALAREVEKTRGANHG